MTDQVIYSMVRVGKIYPPNKPVLRDISLGFFYGAKIGVLGLNGAGKSTLLRIMAGADNDYVGETLLTKGYTRGLLEQEPQLAAGKTVKQVVEEAAQPIVELMATYEAINSRFSDPLTQEHLEQLVVEQARVQEELDKHDAWTLDSRLELALDALRCPPGDTPISVLSGGERRRVALCRLLLTEPDILLLDEPTNHLDAESVAWLERHLQQYKGTVIAVTHDRYFLDNVAGWILELDRGFGIPWRGNYSSWLQQKQERLAREEKAESKRLRTLQRELEWISASPKARQAKGKARITAYNNLLSQEHEQRREELEIYIPPGPRLGDIVVEAKGVSKAYGEKVLFENLTFNLPPGGIVGVIGPNGAGKTTLFELITGNNAPSQGRILVAGRNIHAVKISERDRLAIHYHQSYQVRRFVTLKPSALMASAKNDAPIVHLFDEPQFNTQDGYIGFMLAFFRKLRAEGKLVFVSLHPTAAYHLEILKEIAEEFLVVGGGRVERREDFKSLVADPAVRAYLGADMVARAEAIQ